MFSRVNTVTRNQRHHARQLESLESRMCLTTFPLHHTVFESEPSFQDVHVADVDGDNDLDILSASFAEDKFYWHENKGGGVFESQELPGTHDGARVIATADINGDGTLEVIAGSHEDGTLVSFSGSNLFGSDFVFSKPVEISIEVNGLRDIKVADIDVDGDVDLVVAHSHQVSWFENVNGQGNFRNRGPFITLGQAVQPSRHLQAISIIDVNQDSYPDVIGVNLGGAFSPDPQIAISLGSELGFGEPNITSTDAGNGIWSVETADIDGDGDEDTLLGFDRGQIRIMTNEGGELSLGPFVTEEMDEPQAISIADIDEDGDLDVVVASSGNDRIAWFENRGNNVFFSQPSPILNTTNPTSLIVADVDTDGHPDIVSGIQGGETSQILIHENRLIGDANDDGLFNSSDLVAVFRAGQYEDDEEGNSTFATGDWNGDGEFDTADLVAAFRQGSYTANAVAGAVDSIFSIDSKRTGCLEGDAKDDDADIDWLRLC